MIPMATAIAAVKTKNRIMQPNAKDAKQTITDWWNTLFPILTVIIIIVVIWKVYKASKSAGNAVGAELGINATAVKTGIPAARISYIAQLGQMLWDDGVDLGDWFTATEYKESMFIDAVNAMQSTQELTLLDQYYRSASGETLKTAVNKSFDSSERAKVKPKTWAALMQMV